MFVRWKTQVRPYLTKAWDREAREYRERAPARRLSALLVESVRVNGKPRQKHIAYLGSITEAALGCPLSRQQFWHTTFDALDRLQLDAADRRKVEEAAMARVPKMTRAEYDADVAEASAFFGASWKPRPFRE
jgi:hypothetical protein